MSSLAAAIPDRPNPITVAFFIVFNIYSIYLPGTVGAGLANNTRSYQKARTKPALFTSKSSGREEEGFLDTVGCLFNTEGHGGCTEVHRDDRHFNPKSKIRLGVIIDRAETFERADGGGS
jgi:hypothetical protein